MTLFDGTNAPVIKVYLDTGNRNEGKFILNYSLLGGSDTLGSYTPFTTLTQLPTTDVKRINIRRGRTREDQEIQPGQMILTLDNTSGNYDPEWSNSSTITAASGDGTTVTYTSSTTFLKVGDVVTIVGLTASTLNLKLQTVTSVTSTQFTVSNSATGSCTGQTSAYFYGGYVNTSDASILIAGSGIRVTGTMSGGSETTLFSGFIESMDKDLSLEPTVTITCVDALANLGKMFTNTSVSGLGDADAVAKILTSAGWQGTIVSYNNLYTVSNVPTGSAISMINEITTKQLGLFYVDRLNRAVWRNYNAIAPGAFAAATKLFTLSDQRTSTSEIEYDSITVIGGEKYMRNTINATANYSATSSATFTKFNSTSTGRFGPVAADVDLYFSPTDAPTVAQNLADQFASPEYRVDSISFDCLGFSSTLWNNIMVADPSKAVIVKRTPIYAPQLTYNSWIQELNHDISPNNWRMSLTLSPAT